MGTLNILEIARVQKFIKSVVIITTDKCYENIGKIKSYKESDKLGGVDPYSSSKAAAELMIRAVAARPSSQYYVAINFI